MSQASVSPVSIWVASDLIKSGFRAYSCYYGEIAFCPPWWKLNCMGEIPHVIFSSLGSFLQQDTKACTQVYIAGTTLADLFRLHLVFQVKSAWRLVPEFVEGWVKGVDLDLVLVRFENHVAQPGFSAVMHALVVAQNLMDLVAVIALGSKDRFSTCMPA